MIEIGEGFMSRRSLLSTGSFALLLSVLSQSLLTWGQTSPPTAITVDTTQARTSFELGVAAMQRQAWAEAVAAFESSYRLRRTASVCLNLGVVLLRMGRFSEARVRFQEFNELASPAQHQEHDAEVTQSLATINRNMGRIRIPSIVPPSATVSVDERPAVISDTQELSVDPGEHILRANAQGYRPFEQRVTVPISGVTTLPIVLTLASTTTALPPVTPQREIVREVVRAPAPTNHFYNQWWFWTGVAVLAVGGTVAVVVASQPDRNFPNTTTGRVFNGLTLTPGVSW
jgi:hypothetical protein